MLFMLFLFNFIPKSKKQKKHQSKSWNLCWLCFGLCSLFTFPYTMQFLSSLLLTLDTMSCCYEGETTETRRVKMFDNTFRRCLILIPWILLLEICWHGSDLDRLDLGCSVACLLCCLALSWPKFQDIPSICRKWTFNPLEKVLQNCLQGVPLHNFLSTETFLSATWCGTFACSTKQGPNELKNRRWQTFCMLCIFCYRNMQRWIANFEASLECRMCSMQSYAQLGIHLLVHLVLANLQEGPKKNQPVEEMGPWNLRCLQSIRAWWLADGSFVHVNIPQTCSNDQEVHKYIPGFQVHSAFACNLYCLVFDLSSVWDEEFAFHSLIFCWKRVQLIESERYFLFWTVSFCNPCRNDRLREMRHHTAIISHWIPSFQRQLYVYLLLRFYFASI